MKVNWLGFDWAIGIKEVVVEPSDYTVLHGFPKYVLRPSFVISS